MGDIADMMIDGDLCQSCGVYMGSAGDGFPRSCSSCERDQPRRSDPRTNRAPRDQRKMACPTCGRHVKVAGIRDHMRDKHGATP